MMMPRFTAPVITSFVAGVLIVLVVAVRVPPIMSAFVTSADANEELESAITTLVERHDESRQTYKNRFIGRSLFAPPPDPPIERAAPPPPPPTREEPEDQGDAPPPPPPPPPSAPITYTGPSVLFVIGDQVWFKPMQADAKKLRVRIGETREGVTVISTSPPWSVRVGYAGGEYDVELFGRMDESVFTASNATNTNIGLIDVPAPGTIDDDAGDDAPSGAAAMGAGPAGSGEASPAPAPAPAVAESTDSGDESNDGPTAAPGSLTQDIVDAMTKSQARKVMIEVNNAKREAKDTDPALHAQLTQELAMLLDRLKRD